MILDPTYEELEEMRDSYCEGCKGVFYMCETECWKRCEGFQEELKIIREEME